MDGDSSASAVSQRAKFNIDLQELGVFLADAFVKRIDAFMPADRVTILKACHIRLAAEGGDIVEHLLTLRPHLSSPAVPQSVLPDARTEQIVHTPLIL